MHAQQPTRSPFRLPADERGFSLEATFFVLLLMSALLVTAMTGVATVVRTTDMDYRNTRVYYAAEAGAEAVMAQLHDALEDGSLSDEELGAIEPPTLEGFAFGDLRVERVGEIEVEPITDGPYAGLYSLTQRVNIYAEARDAYDNESGVIVSAKAQAIPIFQFGVFFEKDLEATNGPPMEFAGWVHSNGDIYLSSNNAWYRDQLTTPNDIYWDRKDNHSVKNGVYVNDAVGDEVQLDFDSRSHPDPEDFRARSEQRFDSRVKTGAFEVDSLKVPLPPGMDPVEVIRPREADDSELERKAKIAWQADMYVTVDLEDIQTKMEVCEGKQPSKIPDVVTGNPGVAALQPVAPGNMVNFKVTLTGNCGEFDEADVEVRADGAVVDNVRLNGLSCTFQVTVPAGANKFEVIVTDGVMLDGTEFSGRATWNDLQSLGQNDFAPWPRITVTRPAGKAAPDVVDKCRIFEWQWSAFYDGRETDYRDLLNVDVAALDAWSRGVEERLSEVVYVEFHVPGLVPNKAKSELNDNTLDPGIRLHSGGVLPNRLTVATHYPVYVQGDYNRIAWKPASVMGDAITMLSNAWDDSQHEEAKIIKTNAWDTEYWMAVLAGHSATPCDHEDAGCAGGYTDFYGGGIENYLRFLERWSGETATYRGSLVSLHVSQTVDGTWNGSYYSPPNRDWMFDMRFEEPENLPPGTPTVGNVIHTAFRPMK